MTGAIERLEAAYREATKPIPLQDESVSLARLQSLGMQQVDARHRTEALAMAMLPSFLRLARAAKALVDHGDGESPDFDMRTQEREAAVWLAAWRTKNHELHNELREAVKEMEGMK